MRVPNLQAPCHRGIAVLLAVVLVFALILVVAYAAEAETTAACEVGPAQARQDDQRHDGKALVLGPPSVASLHTEDTCLNGVEEGREGPTGPGRTPAVQAVLGSGLLR